MALEPTSGFRQQDDGRGDGMLSRRQLLGAVGAAGAGAAGVWGLVAGDSLPSSPVRIVYAMARSEPDAADLHPRTKQVPSEWLSQFQLALEVQDKLISAGLSSLVASVVKPGSYDDPTASISIDAADEEIREPLEELTADVPIDLNVLEELPPARDHEPSVEQAAEVSDLGQRTVPSGVVCLANEWYGTLAPALYDERDGSAYFATSNHLFGDAGAKETEHAGEPLALLHENESRPIGEVVRGYPQADLVQVKSVDGYRPTSTIDRTSPGTVIGHYTKVGLADLMARGEPLAKVGALSDRSVGEIKGVDGVTCYTGRNCKPGQVRWGNEETIVDGDSGSVSFHADPDHPDEYVLVAGLNNARTWWPGMDFSWGTAAYQLREAYGLHF